jgi:hypothetical protein
MTIATIPAPSRPDGDAVRPRARPAARASIGPQCVRAFARILAAVVVALLVWIVVMGVSLPSSASTREWRLVWIGFDLGEVVALLVTLAAAYRSRQLAIPAALISGTLFVCDAWFDVVLSWGTKDWWLSIAAAIFLELPLAALLWLGARSLVHALIASQLPAAYLSGRPPRLRNLELLPNATTDGLAEEPSHQVGEVT